MNPPTNQQLLTTSNAASLPPTQRDFTCAFINSKELSPPMRTVAVVQKKRSLALRKIVGGREQLVSYPASLMGCKWPSGHSLASSISFSSDSDDSDDDDEDDDDEQEFNGTSTLVAVQAEPSATHLRRGSQGHYVDSKPFIPRRQVSVPKLDCDFSKDAVDEVTQACEDTSPQSDASKQQHPKEEKPCLSDLLKLPFPVENTAQIVDVNELAQQAVRFQSIVEVGDHRHGVRKHKNCFAGSDAVDQMLEAGLASSRSEAIALGKALMKNFALFRHVTGGHNFKDRDNLFYRFWDQQDNKTEGLPLVPLRRTETIDETEPLGR
ncbi:DEP [Seminavis robusta]|uniref:DEP n=1 Tax=Seminavis robusta TaxID=568900 RepID=A0A9N8DVA2_9STRA|nr:DEP [Seminavis robusta]|eukprot:Sro369_g128250.1 DEP (322) ;mRNA; r:51274-52380